MKYDTWIYMVSVWVLQALKWILAGLWWSGHWIQKIMFAYCCYIDTWVKLKDVSEAATRMALI